MGDYVIASVYFTLYLELFEKLLVDAVLFDQIKCYLHRKWQVSVNRNQSRAMLNFQSRNRVSNINDALTSAIRLLAKKLAHEITESPDFDGYMFGRLAKIRSLYYKGQAYPTLLESWIREF